jgi:hypothetical protein
MGSNRTLCTVLRLSSTLVPFFRASPNGFGTSNNHAGLSSSLPQRPKPVQIHVAVAFVQVQATRLSDLPVGHYKLRTPTREEETSNRARLLLREKDSSLLGLGPQPQLGQEKTGRTAQGTKALQNCSNSQQQQQERRPIPQSPSWQCQD